MQGRPAASGDASSHRPQSAGKAASQNGAGVLLHRIATEISGISASPLWAPQRRHCAGSKPCACPGPRDVIRPACELSTRSTRVAGSLGAADIGGIAESFSGRLVFRT